MKTNHLLALVIAPLLLSNCRESGTTGTDLKTEIATAGDVTFAKSTFESLARGDSAVAQKIDWPVFTAMGNNIGAEYVEVASGVEKEKIVTGFITGFASSFRDSGGSVEAFTNWRVSLHDKLRTEVAADSPGGVMTIIVSERDGVEKVSSINLVK